MLQYGVGVHKGTKDFLCQLEKEELIPMVYVCGHLFFAYMEMAFVSFGALKVLATKSLNWACSLTVNAALSMLSNLKCCTEHAQ